MKMKIRSLIWLLLFARLAAGLDEQVQKHINWWWQPLGPNQGGATTFTQCDDWIAVENVYFHVNRFFAVMDATGGTPQPPQFTKSTPLAPLPVANFSGFLGNIKAGYLEGTTLWLDFPKDAKPEHFGHWAEVLAPTFSHLSLGAAQAAVAKVCNGSSIDPTLPPIRTVIIPNLRRTTILATPWIMHVLKLAVTPGLGPQGAAVSPRLLFWDDLEATDLSTWLIFERAIHIYTRHNHPKTGREVGFASPELGAAFAAAACEAANVSRPQAPPRTITYLMSPIGETIINNGDVLSALRAAAEGTGFTVRPYSPTASVPFSSLVSVMARTGVLVARHGPLMANALFLPPGAAVVELLPHNWVSKGRGEVYVNLTRTTAVVGHVAWFPKSAAEMEYEGAGDARYGNWKAEECSSDDCVDAHARAALRVDPAALEKLAKDVVAAVVKGEPPDTLHKRHPWPRRADPSGRTGLWWDVDQ